MKTVMAYHLKKSKPLEPTQTIEIQMATVILMGMCFMICCIETQSLRSQTA